MHHTVHQAGLDPDRTSFPRTLNAARRHVTAQAARRAPARAYADSAADMT